MPAYKKNKKYFLALEATATHDKEISCGNCNACCCRLEVLLFTDTSVPEHFIEFNNRGDMSMARLDDGWCSALDRNTQLCTIYAQRPEICSDLEMGGYECMAERAENL
ncbi:MAG: YkgJ family cysteine cluster protein [Gammaproteobacteria bacterium]|nr:YkgJ family cysteine cluster protein [Gammaproteobacteria bacterium]